MFFWGCFGVVLGGFCVLFVVCWVVSGVLFQLFCCFVQFSVFLPIVRLVGLSEGCCYGQGVLFCWRVTALETLKSLADNSVDSVVTDPPRNRVYGENVDGSGVAYNVQLWRVSARP